MSQNVLIRVTGSLHKANLSSREDLLEITKTNLYRNCFKCERNSTDLCPCFIYLFFMTNCLFLSRQQKQGHFVTTAGSIFLSMNRRTLAVSIENLIRHGMEGTCPYITLSIALMVY